LTPEAVSAVREGDPIRLRKRLEGDLDSIVLKALRKDPAARYDSAHAFSDDLRRHLDNRPVGARQGSRATTSSGSFAVIADRFCSPRWCSRPSLWDGQRRSGRSGSRSATRGAIWSCRNWRSTPTRSAS
jgi:serine/threonine protein kinase